MGNSGFFQDAGGEQASGAFPLTETIFFKSEIDNGDSGVADTIDWTLGNKQKTKLTGNATLTFTDPGGPTSLVYRVVQDATGSRTVTWPATVKWPGGVIPVLSTGANAIDIVAFYFDGTDYYGNFSSNYS